MAYFSGVGLSANADFLRVEATSYKGVGLSSEKSWKKVESADGVANLL